MHLLVHLLLNPFPTPAQPRFGCFTALSSSCALSPSLPSMAMDLGLRTSQVFKWKIRTTLRLEKPKLASLLFFCHGVLPLTSSDFLRCGQKQNQGQSLSPSASLRDVICLFLVSVGLTKWGSLHVCSSAVGAESIVLWTETCWLFK